MWPRVPSITFTGPITISGPVHMLDPGAVTRPILKAIAALAAQQGVDMSKLDDALADLQAAQTTNTAKLARLITDFENAGSLNPAQQASLDALKSEIVGNSAAIDAADPDAPPPPPPVE